MSPTARTLAHARSLGWICAVVEKWNPHARIRQDLFGVIDVLCIAGDVMIGIQACAGASHAARRTKALKEPRLQGFLAVPSNRFEVWSWAKQGARGKRKVWTLRRESISG